MKQAILLLTLLGSILWMGCAQPVQPTPGPTAVPPTAATSPTPLSAAPTPLPSLTPVPTPTALPPTTTAPPLDPLAAAQQATFSALFSQPPEQDPYRLAFAYLGRAGGPVPVTRSQPLPVGSRDQVTVKNIDLNINNFIDIELLAVSDHAYFWFDQTEGLPRPTQEQLDFSAAAFDSLYAEVIAIFGEENNPGIDGDARIHIINASPLTICDVTPTSLSGCGLLGYFSSIDILPQAIDPTSNEREMFVMNGRHFGTRLYVEVLAHEFRHMIESRYDRSDADWAIEGSAMLAEELLGYTSDAVNRANLFLGNPDQQLNRWTDGNSIPYYGQGYLLNRYIYNRLGETLYGEFARSPANGLEAVTSVAEANGLGFSGYELWLDWLVALAIHDAQNRPQQYALRDGLQSVNARTLSRVSTTLDEEVRQFAADYYLLDGEGSVELTFDGSPTVPLLPVQPTSDERMWVAQRANYSNPRLTRSFDLTALTSATLRYNVFHAIESGYDFAYVSVSTDGGVTWQPLKAPNMQGTIPSDDPSNSALSERFYTGNSGGWVAEEIDLTPYVGQVVDLRFEYVTDLILTFDGLALDDIEIPELGFRDAAESDAGWVAEGFIRATGEIPQLWHLFVITFVNQTPQIASFPLDEAARLTLAVDLDRSGGGAPILIVSASSPMTLLPAGYQITLAAVDS